MEYLKSMLIIITSIFGILTISFKWINSFFDNYIKTKTMCFEGKEKLSSIIINWIGGIVYSVYLVIIVCFIYIIYKQGMDAFTSGENNNENINVFYNLIGTCMTVSIACIFTNFSNIVKQYILKFKKKEYDTDLRFELFGIGCSILASIFSSGIISFKLIIDCLLVFNDNMVTSKEIIKKIIVLFILWMISMSFYILSKNLIKAILKIKSNNIYYFITNDTTEIVMSFLENEDYYCFYSNNKETYLRKSEVKTIRVHKNIERKDISVCKFKIFIYGIHKYLTENRDKFKNKHQSRVFKVIIWLFDKMFYLIFKIIKGIISLIIQFIIYLIV